MMILPMGFCSGNYEFLDPRSSAQSAARGFFGSSFLCSFVFLCSLVFFLTFTANPRRTRLCLLRTVSSVPCSTPARPPDTPASYVPSTQSNRTRPAHDMLQEILAFVLKLNLHQLAGSLRQPACSASQSGNPGWIRSTTKPSFSAIAPKRKPRPSHSPARTAADTAAPTAHTPDAP